MSSDTVYCEPLPGGCAWVTGGGTRITVKLSRPWQSSLEEFLSRSTCPIETKPQSPIALPGIPEHWFLLPNPMTPHRWHRLVVPAWCWGADTLRVLGGEEAIVHALETVQLAIADDSVEMATFIHVGQFAGQNLRHPHWHLMEVRARQPLEGSSPVPEERFVMETDYFIVCAGGVRSGQCLFFPKQRCALTPGVVRDFASLLSAFVTRANEKWRSTEGLPPEFTVALRLSSEHTIRYASYCPILNHWGVPEYVFAPLEEGPFTLPWPHEVTAAHLRNV